MSDVTIIHTEPVNDLLAHEDEDCPCLPVVEPVPRSDGSIGWHVIHNAWDDRE